MFSFKKVNSFGKTDSSVQTKKITADITIKQQNFATHLQRIAAKDKTAVEECLNKHGRLVWGLAKQFTVSPEEAETATQEIFLEIWKSAERFESMNCKETDFIILVVRRWLSRRKINSVLAPSTDS